MSLSYYTEESISKVGEQPALASLNLRLNDHNNKLSSLSEKLYSISGRVSENHPVPQDQIEGETKSIPFNEGSLMEYYRHLEYNQKLLNDLESTIDKLSKLI